MGGMEEGEGRGEGGKGRGGEGKGGRCDGMYAFNRMRCKIIEVLKEQCECECECLIVD